MKKLYVSLAVAVLGICLFPAFGNAAANDFDTFDKACGNLSAAERAQSAVCNANKQVKECVKDEENKGADGNTLNCNPVSGGENGILYRITRIVTVIAGAAAVIIIIIGGINMMTSGGDSQKFTNGRNTIIFAAVGLVVIVLAQMIITFSINKFL